MAKIKDLWLDLETYSSASLADSGVYKYAEAGDFKILLFAYSADGAPVRVIDLANGERIPQEVLDAIQDKTVTKHAYNAMFERVCLSRYIVDGTYLNPANWKCTMVWAASLGLPLSLEACGRELGIAKAKMTEGKRLIKLFCVLNERQGLLGPPCRESNPREWELFKQYNQRDVEAEMEIEARLRKLPLPESEWRLYELDQEINDRGIRIDRQLAQSAIACDQQLTGRNLRRAYEICGVENPNSVSQLKGWLKSRGIEAATLGKKAVAEMLDRTEDVEAAELLRLRLEMAKTSVKKYETMERCVCRDGRVRGLLQFYGANRTGRWSGRLVQVQNLPQNHLSDLHTARELVKQREAEALEWLYESPGRVLSELIRTAFVPRDGHRFLVADFSAIEARVIAWLAGETWRQEVFAQGGDIYCASASQMFRVPVEKHGVNGHLRQKGKIAELALGYGGSVGALKAMGALEMGLKEAELKPLVDAWRSSNPSITALWWAVDKAVGQAVRTGARQSLRGIAFQVRSGILGIRLPSGRWLNYVKPRIEENRFGGECITYAGTEAKAARVESYGPKFVENIVQAMSRDLLAHALLNVKKAGFETVMHVHDEIVVEASKEANLDELCAQMALVPDWCRGLQLRADGYECEFYRKD